MSLKVVIYLEENSLEDTQKNQLEAEFSRLYAEHFGKAISIKTVWMLIPRGQAYVARESSSVPTVAAPVPDGTTNTLRQQFLHDMLAIWVKHANVERHKVVISATDVSLLDTFMKASVNRTSGVGKIRYIARVLLRVLRAKFKTGRFENSVNV
ncbi:hypothetical protein OE749_01710 [Aestuariibacter sp. AA17]|uniref:Uncharacterized protein n=1 Tax=Fluctibacter corallii TaxID=2984329 RepID=A0ABT3A3Z9_9ALTE|nr:hypothetical protein [Aestuariibacter sp. AA17]MCV2883413.1 hypothetical protein [Aestuariibacter sp. AA17]